jgi:hypothetical protein
VPFIDMRESKDVGVALVSPRTDMGSSPWHSIAKRRLVARRPHVGDLAIVLLGHGALADVAALPDADLVGLSGHRHARMFRLRRDLPHVGPGRCRR